MNYGMIYGQMMKKKITFADEYNNSKHNFELLKHCTETTYLPLTFYVNNVQPSWNNPEWGFPKGRRNIAESDLNCAIREFEEETGFNNTQYTMLSYIEPLIENLIGTNGKQYRHIYYLAITYQNIIPKIDKVNFHQSEEIGDIGLYNYEDTLNLIRSYHYDRKKILTIVFMYILNKFVNRSEDTIPHSIDDKI